MLLRSSFGLDTLHIDLDHNLVADDHLTTIQRRAKVEIELLQSRRWKSKFTVELFLCVTIMQRALDLASAVTTHLDAVGPASRQARLLGHGRGRILVRRGWVGAIKTYCVKYAFLPRGSPRLSHMATAQFRHEPS